MDNQKSAVPSQSVPDRAPNLVVINPGSANIKLGLASMEAPLEIPHCIARRTTGANQTPKRTIQDQKLNSQVTTAQHVERERAYDSIASYLKIPLLGEEIANSYSRKMARLDGSNPQTSSNAQALTWTDVLQKNQNIFSGEGAGKNSEEPSDMNKMSEFTYKEFICGEEALRISLNEPYCVRRPIRRGHFNVSPHYSTQQVIDDLHAIWDWIITDKLSIPLSQRSMYSVVLVVPETFDSREIKEVLSVVLRDLNFNNAVVHQEGLAAVFGNGLSTACVVNMGAQVTSVVCIEDGVALPGTGFTLNFGGEDISRCLLWTQRHHQTWPPIRTDALAKPIDMLMLNKLKESYCQIKEGETESVAVVHAHEDGMSAVAHKTRLTALNVPPMGLFHPKLLVPDVYPPPPRTWFEDYEGMLEDTLNMEYRRSDMSDGLYYGMSPAMPMWETYPVLTRKPNKEDCILGLAEAITTSILSSGRIDLQRKLFCSIQLVGGVALTRGLVAVVEDKVLHAIPSTEAIDTVEVVQSRTDPTYVSWKGGAIMGIVDIGKEGWIDRKDWENNGISPKGDKKYKDGYYIQAQAMCYINS